MFTPDERRALFFLGAVALAGGVVRAAGSGREAPAAALPPAGFQAQDVDAQLARVREAEASQRPLSPGERIDVDRASAAEIERLPRVGPALARRIVEDREKNGPFGSVEALDAVPGIGPALLEALRTRVSFSGSPRPPGDAGSRAPARPGAARASGGHCVASGRVAVNRATARELACLPGIGPKLAGRIVQDRVIRGPYRQVEDLQRVPGIGPVLSRRLAPLLLVP